MLTGALTITIWLAISADSGAASTGSPPMLPAWPSGLSEPIVRGDETCLLRDLADAVHYRLAACEALPGRCQARIDGAVARCKADAMPAHPAESSSWPVWIASAAVGVAVGLVAGVALGG